MESKILRLVPEGKIEMFVKNIHDMPISDYFIKSTNKSSEKEYRKKFTIGYSPSFTDRVKNKNDLLSFQSREICNSNDDKNYITNNSNDDDNNRDITTSIPPELSNTNSSVLLIKIKDSIIKKKNFLNEIEIRKKKTENDDSALFSFRKVDNKNFTESNQKTVRINTKKIEKYLSVCPSSLHDDNYSSNMKRMVIAKDEVLQNDLGCIFNGINLLNKNRVVTMSSDLHSSGDEKNNEKEDENDNETAENNDDRVGETDNDNENKIGVESRMEGGREKSVLWRNKNRQQKGHDKKNNAEVEVEVEKEVKEVEEGGNVLHDESHVDSFSSSHQVNSVKPFTLTKTSTLRSHNNTENSEYPYFSNSHIPYVLSETSAYVGQIPKDNEFKSGSFVLMKKEIKHKKTQEMITAKTVEEFEKKLLLAEKTFRQSQLKKRKMKKLLKIGNTSTNENLSKSLNFDLLIRSSDFLCTDFRLFDSQNLVTGNENRDKKIDFSFFECSSSNQSSEEKELDRKRRSVTIIRNKEKSELPSFSKWKSVILPIA